MDATQVADSNDARYFATLISEDADVRPYLRSIVWIGSRSRNQDVHRASDIDLQLILDEPRVQVLLALHRILGDCSGLDLSVMYVRDVFDPAGNLIFQDGTKGQFFLPVLAGGAVLYGEDMYAAAVENMDEGLVRESLTFTVREYLSRLRVMAVMGVEGAHSFNKYAVKLLRDILVLEGALTLEEMATMSNSLVMDLASRRWHGAQGTLKQLGSPGGYMTRLPIDTEVHFLVDLERIASTALGERSGD